MKSIDLEMLTYNLSERGVREPLFFIFGRGVLILLKFSFFNYKGYVNSPSEIIL
jgi:hypothetical protein